MNLDPPMAYQPGCLKAAYVSCGKIVDQYVEVMHWPDILEWHGAVRDSQISGQEC